MWITLDFAGVPPYTGLKTDETSLYSVFNNLCSLKSLWINWEQKIMKE